MTVAAYAKINLSLEILGRRTDGYHDLVSVMQTISLRDVLQFELDSDISLRCSDPTLSGEANLASRAARALRDHCDSRQGCDIYVCKAIPVGAGLGGGSSDAACVLRTLRTLWNLDITERTLLSLASQLGSDVPFFLRGGTALIEGRGERVRVISSCRQTWCVLAMPQIIVNTSSVYEELARSEWTDGGTTRRLASKIGRGEIPRVGCNGLQAATFRLYPEVRTCFEELSSLAPGRTLLAGSGGSIFALSRSAAEVARISRSMTERGYASSVHMTVAPEQYRHHRVRQCRAEA